MTKPTCQTCDGTGVYEEDAYRESTGHYTREIVCPDCQDDDHWAGQYDCDGPDDVDPDYDDGRECSYRDTSY